MLTMSPNASTSSNSFFSFCIVSMEIGLLRPKLCGMILSQEIAFKQDTYGLDKARTHE